jgi:hypothetical protein
MKRMFSLTLVASLLLVLVSAREMWGQGTETVGSLAAKGFEVRGITSGPGNLSFVVVMQKGAAVYLCVQGSDCILLH